MISRKKIMGCAAALAVAGLLAFTSAGSVLAQRIRDTDPERLWLIGLMCVVLLAWGAVVHIKRKREREILRKKQALNRRFHSR